MFQRRKEKKRKETRNFLFQRRKEKKRKEKKRKETRNFCFRKEDNKKRKEKKTTICFKEETQSDKQQVTTNN